VSANCQLLWTISACSLRRLIVSLILLLVVDNLLDLRSDLVDGLREALEHIQILRASPTRQVGEREAIGVEPDVLTDHRGCRLNDNLGVLTAVIRVVDLLAKLRLAGVGNLVNQNHELLIDGLLLAQADPLADDVGIAVGRAENLLRDVTLDAVALSLHVGDQLVHRPLKVIAVRAAKLGTLGNVTLGLSDVELLEASEADELGNLLLSPVQHVSRNLVAVRVNEHLLEDGLQDHQRLLTTLDLTTLSLPGVVGADLEGGILSGNLKLGARHVVIVRVLRPLVGDLKHDQEAVVVGEPRQALVRTNPLLPARVRLKLSDSLLHLLDALSLLLLLLPGSLSRSLGNVGARQRFSLNRG
jgi:hypothetical protein